MLLVVGLADHQFERRGQPVRTADIAERPLVESHRVQIDQHLERRPQRAVDVEIPRLGLGQARFVQLRIGEGGGAFGIDLDGEFFQPDRTAGIGRARRMDVFGRTDLLHHLEDRGVPGRVQHDLEVVDPRLVLFVEAGM